MRIRIVVIATLVMSLALVSNAQVEKAKISILAVLVDKDLNQKPIPLLAITIADTGNPQNTVQVRTGSDGKAQAELAPGVYQISTAGQLEFQSRKYTWDIPLTITDASKPIEIILTNDNAKTIDLSPAPEKPKRITDDMTANFQKYQNSVATVWSEFGHGTGFFFQRTATEGLLLTNQHVVGPSEYLSVQFDNKRKVPAVLLAADAEKDVAVLWVNLEQIPEAIIAPIAIEPNGKSIEQPVIEGEKVFTIGSPLEQRKIITTGIVSKIEPKAIISDININHGNSGGPLFNSIGQVVGLTTFGEGKIAGIIRIEETIPVINKAVAALKEKQKPQALLLPVEPDQKFPISAIKDTLEAEKFDARPYLFNAGDFEVGIITPPLYYRMTEGGSVKAAKVKEKRNNKPESVKGTFRPLDDLKGWAEYVGGYKPVLLIRAMPELKVTWGSAIAKGLTYGAAPYKFQFKTDFYKMKLFCDDHEIQPIFPGKIAHVYDTGNAFAQLNDATYEGIYSYPYDAISNKCSNVTLQIFGEKNVNKPTVKTLDIKTINRVNEDFMPYRRIVTNPQ